MRTISISDEDYGYLTTLRRQFGTYANALSSVIHAKKAHEKEITTLKKEVKALKKELKGKDGLISHTLASVVSQKASVHYVPLTPPPTPHACNQPLTDAMYPARKIKPIKVLTEQELAERQITNEIKTKFDKIEPEIRNTRNIRPSDLQEPLTQEK